MAANLRYVERFRPTVAAAHAARETMAASDWPGFTLAAAAGTLRTGALFGFQAFVPLYVWRTLDSSEGVGNVAISVMLAPEHSARSSAGASPTCHGFRKVVVLSLFASVPLALLVPVSRCSRCFRVLALFGLISEMNFYPLVVARAAGAATARGIRLGRHARPQHRRRLALRARCSASLADHTSLRTALFGAAS